MTESWRCVVCPHQEAGDHLMAANAREFTARGDYCLRCQKFCKGGRTA